MSTTTISRTCRAKNPATCRTHGTGGTQNVSDLYQTWLTGDMEDNDGRWARAKAYLDAVEAWQCGETVVVSSISHDSGLERLSCHLRKNHDGDHDPKAKYPWQ